MDKLKAAALQAAKEIVVKFVETGRISPANFAENFAPIYNEVLRTISAGEPESAAGGETAKARKPKDV
ncbi:MAG: hypothetical protein HQK81_12530 [Desulfovibrionaceae bacterium]|nr:hypothetical protein [Desulfovibrionaceae bacterium]MBF0514870.1 hypothetical protein [Desulfovibrionaceae bacterium]